MALIRTDFVLPGQRSFYRGKVRDVYVVNDLIISVATDRISAFDHVLPEPIPHKGQVLNQLARHFLLASRHLAPNWYLCSPDPNVTVGIYCEPIKIEMVIRGYLAGHASREYARGARTLCGEIMPNGLKPSDPFPKAIITPATKAPSGHDEDISRKDILSNNIVEESVYVQMETYTYSLFALGQKMAKDRGLILVDTKYEFGIKDGLVYLIDEIHTPDSSRYFYLDGYEDRQRKGESQIQLSKEFVREWLVARGFQGKEDQRMPEMPKSFVESVSRKYLTVYEKLVGTPMKLYDMANIKERVEQNIISYLENRK